MSERIRFGTNIITFFNTEYWGLPGDLSHPQWVSAFNDKPHHYFERMFDGVRDAGLEGVELAPDPGGWEAALAAYGSTDALKQALSERGLVLSSSYSAGRQLIGNALMDPAAEAVADDNMARHARFLVEMGADIITIGKGLGGGVPLAALLERAVEGGELLGGDLVGVAVLGVGAAAHVRGVRFHGSAIQQRRA